MSISTKNITERGNSKHKGSEVGTCLVSSRSKEVKVAVVDGDNK